MRLSSTSSCQPLWRRHFACGGQAGRSLPSQHDADAGHGDAGKSGGWHDHCRCASVITSPARCRAELVWPSAADLGAPFVALRRAWSRVSDPTIINPVHPALSDRRRLRRKHRQLNRDPCQSSLPGGCGLCLAAPRPFDLAGNAQSTSQRPLPPVTSRRRSRSGSIRSRDGALRGYSAVRGPHCTCAAAADQDGRVPLGARGAVAQQRMKEINNTPGGVALVPAELPEFDVAQHDQGYLDYVPAFSPSEMGRLTAVSSAAPLSRNFHCAASSSQWRHPINTRTGYGDFQEDRPTATKMSSLQGGNALQFGANSLGGAINFVTPTGETISQRRLVRFRRLQHQSGCRPTPAAPMGRGTVCDRVHAGTDGFAITVSIAHNVNQYATRHFVSTGTVRTRHISRASELTWRETMLEPKAVIAKTVRCLRGRVTKNRPTAIGAAAWPAALCVEAPKSTRRRWDIGLALSVTS